MAKHERAPQDKQADIYRKHRKKRQQESQHSSGKLHTYDSSLFPGSETPFYPRMDEHAKALLRIPFSAQRQEFISRLQHTYGNGYVQRLMESMKVQAKLTVSEPNDIYEQEADKVAEEVTRSVNTPVLRQAPEEDEELMQGKLVQRQSPEEEELIQGTFNVQRQAPEEEELIQGRFDVQRKEQADMSNQQLMAKTFTTGPDLFFKQGANEPAMVVQRGYDEKAVEQFKETKYGYLLNGIDEKMTDNQKVAQLLDNFYRRDDFKYTGEKVPRFQGEGDCETLSMEFKQICEDCFNLEMKYAGTRDNLIVPKPQRIVGGQTGNVDGGRFWIFTSGHVWLEWRGLPIDVLFGQYGQVSHIKVEDKPIKSEEKEEFPCWEFGDTRIYLKRGGTGDLSNYYTTKKKERAKTSAEL